MLWEQLKKSAKTFVFYCWSEATFNGYYLHLWCVPIESGYICSLAGPKIRDESIVGWMIDV